LLLPGEQGWTLRCQDSIPARSIPGANRQNYPILSVWVPVVTSEDSTDRRLI
jgi:hypothetical protein